MPAPRWLARFNRWVTNHLTGRLAARFLGVGVIGHRGQKIGRPYRTPVNVFRHGGAYVIALTYGPPAEWVRNVLAQKGCTRETHGRTLQLSRPRLVHDGQRRAMPVPARQILGLLNMADFPELMRVERTADPVEVRRAE